MPFVGIVSNLFNFRKYPIDFCPKNFSVKFKIRGYLFIHRGFDP